MNFTDSDGVREFVAYIEKNSSDFRYIKKEINSSNGENVNFVGICCLKIEINGFGSDSSGKYVSSSSLTKNKRNL